MKATLNQFAQSSALLFTCLLPFACGTGDGGGSDGVATGDFAVTVNSGSTMAIVGVQSGNCLGVSGSSTANGALVQMQGCNGSTFQRWVATRDGAGDYELRNVGSGRCLDVSGNSTAAGTNIQQWGCAGSSNQKWNLADQGGAVFAILSRSSGLALDVFNFSTANGARVVQWSYLGGANQRWTLSGATFSGGSTGGGTGAGGGVVGQPIGFATLNGGTRGGAGGQVVTASTYAQLKSFAESTATQVILVQGTISNGSGGGTINVRSNKSLVGVGGSAFLSGVGLNIANSNNVIVQNLRVSLVGTTTPASVNGGDAISISGTSKNVWIDHCELFSENPAVQTNIDKYDGLIDIKGQTGFITISRNFLHDHHKGCLVGAADTDVFADRKITFHHNHFRNVRLRVPTYRGAVGHFFNNYVVGATDATEVRTNTCVRVERNYYEPLHFSIYTPSDSPGRTQRIENTEVGRTSRAYPANCTADIPYAYSTTATADVRTVVPQGAGVGKI